MRKEYTESKMMFMDVFYALLTLWHVFMHIFDKYY